MKVKPVNPFIARILDPEDDVTMFEIVAHNARVSRDIADHSEATAHPPCSNKNCSHGNPRAVAEQRAHTRVLEQEAIALAQEIA